MRRETKTLWIGKDLLKYQMAALSVLALVAWVLLEVAGV